MLSGRGSLGLVPQAPAIPVAPQRAERVPAPQPRALSETERAELRDALNSEELYDDAPATAYAKLLDQGMYLGSVSTMYRVLRAHGEVRERRRHATHPAHVKPELVATGPNQVWSWDITKLRGPVKWTWFYLYVILDIYSRYVVGWMLARAELARSGQGAHRGLGPKAGRRSGPADLARRSWVTDEGQARGALARGPGCRAVAQPSSHLERQPVFGEPVPHHEVPRPEFPDRFGCFEDAHDFCGWFFGWYNDEHRHSGIGLHTPADVHYGRAEAIRARRGVVLDAAYAAHPERFVRKRPEPPALPTVAWINDPSRKEVATSIK